MRKTLYTSTNNYVLRYSSPVIVRRRRMTHPHPITPGIPFTYVQHHYLREDDACLSIIRSTTSQGGTAGFWEAFCQSQDENPRGWIPSSELRGILKRFASYHADVLGNQIKE